MKSEFTETVHRFSQENVISLVKFLINNIYLHNGNQITRQKLGIPMGTNCAPALANIYLYAYESAYIDSLPEDKARKFHMTFRLIDDVLSIDNDDWAAVGFKLKHEGGIYPLQLNDTSISNQQVHFIGLSLQARSSSIDIDVFDKRKEFPFKVVRYPHMASLIPTSLPYGVFIGQLTRYYRICTRYDSFVVNSVGLAKQLMAQGASLYRLLKSFTSFLRNQRKLRWKNITLQQLRLRFSQLISS
jgi:hypothetical protein